MDQPDTTRRRWVKQFIFGSVATLTAPKWIGTVLAEVTPTGPGPGVIRLKAADIIVQELVRGSNGQRLRDQNGNAVFMPVAPLAHPGGSVQLNLIQGSAPLTLNRVSADRFVALDSICTHAGCTVARFIVANNQMRCPCHGSRYDIEGKVFRDENGFSTEPAPDDLGRYATSYDAPSDMISITIPDLALHINSISVHREGPGDVVRLKLVFPVSYGAIYEIRYQTDLSGPSALISYSKTATGLANRTTVGPEEEGSFTAYVDASGPKGFFTVGLRLTTVEA
jgi:Rieske Fe-S protein